MLPGFADGFDLFWRTARELLGVVDFSEEKARSMGLTVGNAFDVEYPDEYQAKFDFDAENVDGIYKY